MRFGQSFNSIAIAEWKECYLDYQILKIFVMVIKEIVEGIEECDLAIKEFIDSEHCPDSRDGLAGSGLQVLGQLRVKLRAQLQQQNELFFRIYLSQAEITELFYQMKVIQIEERYDICARLNSRNMRKELVPIFLTYIEYAYIEISYISEMREANIEAERKILKKHKKYAHKLAETPQPSHEKITRMASIQEDYISKIEDLYVSVHHEDMASKDAREFLREAAHKTEVGFSDYFLFGLGVGATVVLLGTLIFIIEYENLSIENSSAAFSRDFPTWRGVAIFILYIWILGLDVYCFQRYKISHRLIFNFNDHHYSSSSSVFKIAGFFTALFMIVFLVYLLFVSKIIKTDFRSEYLALAVWGALSIYVFVPLPIFNYEGRLYAIKLILRSLASPILGVQFVITWMTDQWISMATPLRDIAYTVCYYTRLDFNVIAVNPCKANSSFQVVLLVVVIAISYRIMQCLRVGYQQGKYWMTPHMGNTFKYIASLIASVLSYVYNLGYPNLLGIWIMASAISTLYSYFWDLKYDWGLLQGTPKNWLLRKYLTFQPKRNYYIVIVMNFIMRLSWMMTISPSIALYFGNSSLLTFVTGSIEIMRRGIWNLLRVEKEHLKNCNEFKAVPDMKDIEKQLEDQGQFTQLELVNQNEETSRAELRQTIKKSYITLIKKKIQDREAQERTYNDDYEANRIREIKEYKKRIKDIRKSIKKDS